MPNTPVPAAATGLPSDTPRGRIPAGAAATIIPVSRRAVLAALVALPAVCLPAPTKRSPAAVPAKGGFDG